MTISKSSFTPVSDLYRLSNSKVFNRLGKRLSCLKEGERYSLYMDKTFSMDGNSNIKLYLVVDKKQREVYRYDYEVGTGDVKRLKEFVDMLNGSQRGYVRGRV